jgi:predicted MPP superfamily phosphohydrolase
MGIEILICLLILAILVVIWICLYDSNRFEVTERTYCDKRIKKPLRAVVLADLHDKQYGYGNERLLSAIDELHPDLILVAGDLLTAHPHEKLDKVETFLRPLAEKYPILYSNGNHAHRMKLYPQTYGDLAEQYGKLLKELKIPVLVNEAHELEGYGISVYGTEIDRYYYERFGIRSMAEDYLRSILGEPRKDTYNILIGHNPDYADKYAAWGADLSLCGHVHGGIARIPLYREGKWRLCGVASPNIRFFPHFDCGEFTLGERKVYVSRGLGMHTIPFRFLNPGELILLEFKPEESRDGE